MKEYVMTSPLFEGEVKFEFGESGRLVKLEVPDAMGIPQRIFLFSHLPVSAADFERSFKTLLKDIRSPAVITEIVREVTFDDFWKRYFAGRSSDNSSKKKSQLRWSRMTNYQHVKAYNYIQRYFAKIPAGVGVKLAETYLNSEIWDN